MGNLLTEFTNTIALMKAQAGYAFVLLLILWAIHIVNSALNYRLNVLGIYPRRPQGLMGIVFSPVLHGNYAHITFNSIPFFFLTDFLLVSGTRQFYLISACIMLLSGFATWCVGRKAIHIGASSLILGYFGYLLTNAILHPNGSTIIIAIFTVYYFGSLIFNLFPTDVKTSWEGHLFGFLAGIATVYLLPMIGS